MRKKLTGVLDKKKLKITVKYSGVLAFSVLLALFINVATGLTAPGDLEISDGSVQALWHLEDVVDSSGNGYNLTNTNSITFGAGKIDNGADSGTGNTNKKLSVADDLNITNGDMSVSLWSASDVNTTVGGIFEHSDATTDFQEWLFYHGGVPATWTSKAGDNTNKIGYNGTMTTDTWYHLVVTIDAGTLISLYRNGTLVATSTDDQSGIAGKSDLTTLFYSPVYTNYFSGQIDEVVVFNKVLSQTDVDNLYNSGAGIAVCNTAGCADEEASTSTPASSTLALSDQADSDVIKNFVLILIPIFVLFTLLTVFYRFWGKFGDLLAGRKDI